MVPAMLVAGLVLAGCGDDTGAGGSETTPAVTSPTATDGQTGAGAQVDLAALLQNPNQYDEQRVTTSGVADQLTPFVLALTPPGAGTPAPGTAVQQSPTGTQTTSTAEARQRLIVTYGNVTPPQEGSTVTVSGTVQDTFDVAAIEKTLGITLDRQVIESLGLGEDDVVLVADSVQTATGTGSPTATSPS